MGADGGPTFEGHRVGRSGAAFKPVHHCGAGMRLTDALRWAIYDRAIAFGSFLLGALVAAGIVFLGAGGSLTTFLFEDLSSTPGTRDLAVLGVGIFAGVFVWQVGRATARHRTMVTATERQVDEHLDHDAIARAAVSKIDDRIGSLEGDVEEVRRQAARLEQAMRSGDFDVAELEQGVGQAPSDGPAGLGGAGADAAGASAADDGPSDASGPGTGASSDGASGDTGATAGDAGTVDAEPPADPDPSADTEATGTVDGGGEDADAGGEAAPADDAGAAGPDDASDDDAGDDGFEWGDDQEDEYYRNS